ncbi:RNA-binding protein 43-like [Narcine bancroftii]|uniref:RNA-binding protein 43-like n=1 Tax=Narcine bancroftii TaxID=1343680 RepID=UPI0038322A82
MLGRECRSQQSEVKSQHPKKIQVQNIPKLKSVQQTLDKLTIHFQTQSNGGGEVQMVEYPTCVKDCAFITFVTEKDANNVLKHEQILKLDKKKYKLEVCRAGEGESTTDDVQVIEFVCAQLDTSNFTTEMVHQLIQKYNFEILSHQGSIVKIKGSFSSLKQLRNKLMDLIISRPMPLTNNQRHNGIAASLPPGFFEI